MSERLQIAIGVLRRGKQVLLARRQSHQHLAGFWEFPGGKLEAGETPEAALTREFEEEVGVTTRDWQPLIQIPWDYEKVSVLLNVYETEQFDGEPHGAEGQTVQWAPISELSHFEFPDANRGLVQALQLPEHYMISGGFHDAEDALNRLEAALDEGIRLVQLRAKTLDESAFQALAKQAVALTHRYAGARIVLNGKPEDLQAVPDADGLQLASTAIMGLTERPIPGDKLLGVSTHSDVEIAKALELNADFILLSPVKKTQSHPELEGLGWPTFAEQVANVPVPVFALGGMKPTDVGEARQNGGQGIAAISGLWPEPI